MTKTTQSARPIHTLGFVDWDVMHRRRREKRAVRSYYYGSEKKWVLKAGYGGTAWFITSNKAAKPRTFHLAFRLVDCKILEDPPADLRERWGPNMIVARNWNASEHYPLNDFNDLFPRLRFRSGKQLGEMERRYWSTRLVSFPELSWNSVLDLESFAHGLMTDRSIFLSYSHRDQAAADHLVSGLEQRGVHILRDVDHLLPGDRWSDQLTKFARGSDIILVLVTPASAHSREVHKEVRWALQGMCTDGLVRRIMPIFYAESDLEAFPDLAEFQGLPHRKTNAFLDDLASRLRRVPRRRPMGWSSIDSKA
jgi:hypothetical protein